MMAKYPVILTIPVVYPNGYWEQRFWCKPCRGYHYHSRGAGYRAAQCTNPDSPYKVTGYYLWPVWSWRQEFYEPERKRRWARYRSKQKPGSAGRSKRL